MEDWVVDAMVCLWRLFSFWDSVLSSFLSRVWSIIRLMANLTRAGVPLVRGAGGLGLGPATSLRLARSKSMPCNTCRRLADVTAGRKVDCVGDSLECEGKAKCDGDLQVCKISEVGDELCGVLRRELRS